MRKQLALWELGGFLFTAALGTALHFTYGWSGGNLLAAAFPLSTNPCGSI